MLDNIDLAIGKLTFRSKLNDFYEELLENLQMNIAVSHFLQTRRQLALKRKKGGEAAIYKLMLQRMEEGGSLSEAGRGLLPNSNLIMIQAGEHVAKIAAGVESALFANRSMTLMRAAVTKHLLTPIIMLIALFGLMMLFGFTVIPQFLFILPLERLGMGYRVTYTIMQTLSKNYLTIVPTLVVMIWGIVISVTRLTGTIRDWLDKLPPYSIVRQYVSASLLINISGLLRNNVTLQDAVSLLLRDASSYERYHLATIKRRLNNGLALTAALDTGLIPYEVVDRLVSFEQAGSSKLEEIIKRIGFENIDKSLRVVERNVLAVASMIKIVVGAMLGWLVYDTFTLGNAVNAMVRSGM